jgi:hypothetical protein
MLVSWPLDQADPSRLRLPGELVRHAWVPPPVQGPWFTIAFMDRELAAILEADADGNVKKRRRSPLEGRRILAAAILAVVEIVAFIIWRPSALLLSVAALAVLILAVALIPRTRPGFLRDVLIVVASAQALVVLIPLLLAASLAVGIIVAIILVIGLIIAASLPGRLSS